MRQLNAEHRGHNNNEGDIMLIVVGKNGTVQLLSDGQPAKAPALPEREERERQYAVIERRLQEECGVERAPVVKPEKN
jgi:hypothetical protein